MDAGDEELARRLQAEEYAAAAAPPPGSRQGEARMAGLLSDAISKALSYEEELAQAMALSVMPMDQLAGAAEEACAVSAAMGEDPLQAYDDALAQEMLAWFKGFFTWVNAAPCDACGSVNTVGAGMGRPTEEEAAHGAGRVELYRCPACTTVTRFPRYNDPVKLLETRRGRCGEWANCFTLCCRAAGLDVRLAVDLEDHIWTEQWSEAQQKWVHLDPCEAACDKPLLYEAGWGKRLSYVIGVGRNGAADVTRRYTRDFGEVQKKRVLVSEEWLAAQLGATTARLRARLPAEERRRLEQRDELDMRFMATGGAPLAPADLAALPARTTGDAAWLAARGEDGRDGAAAQQQQQQGSGASTSAAKPAEAQGTRYRLAKDEGLRASQPGRLCGGAVRASGENAPGEAARCAFDGNAHSKWLDFGGQVRDAAWLEYRLPADQVPAVLESYALTSANDSPERDPAHVVLEAWSEGSQAWVQLDERSGLLFPRRHQRLHFTLPGSSGDSSSSGPSAASTGQRPAGAQQQPSRRFRLRIVSVLDPGAANSVQLACLDLYGRPQEEQPSEGKQAAGQQHGEQAAGQQQAARQQQPEPLASQLKERLQLRAEQPARAAKSRQQEQPQQPPMPPLPAQPVQQPASLSAAPGTGQQPQPAEPGNPWATLFGAPPS